MTTSPGAQLNILPHIYSDYEWIRSLTQTVLGATTIPIFRARTGELTHLISVRASLMNRCRMWRKHIVCTSIGHPTAEFRQRSEKKNTRGWVLVSSLRMLNADNLHFAAGFFSVQGYQNDCHQLGVQAFNSSDYRDNPTNRVREGSGARLPSQPPRTKKATSVSSHFGTPNSQSTNISMVPDRIIRSRKGFLIRSSSMIKPERVRVGQCF